MRLEYQPKIFCSGGMMQCKDRPLRIKITSGKLLSDYFVQCFNKAIVNYTHLRTKLYVQTVVEKHLVLPFRFQCV
jgi:hypothetical protein